MLRLWVRGAHWLNISLWINESDKLWKCDLLTLFHKFHLKLWGLKCGEIKLLTAFRIHCHTDMCASLGELNNRPGGSRHAPTGPQPILMWQKSMQVLSVDTRCPINSTLPVVFLKTQTYTHTQVWPCLWGLSYWFLSHLPSRTCLTLTWTLTFT